MSVQLYNQPLQFLSNEEILEIVSDAIKEEKKKKQKSKTKGSVTINRFLKSKLFNKKW